MNAIDALTGELADLIAELGGPISSAEQMDLLERHAREMGPVPDAADGERLELERPLANRLTFVHELTE